MAIRLKDLTDQPELLSGGHRACAGCTAPSALRQMMLVAGRDINATEVETIFASLAKIKKSGKPGELYRYIGLRE